MSGNKINKDEDRGNKMSEFDKKMKSLVYPYRLKLIFAIIAIQRGYNVGDYLKLREREKFGLRVGAIIGNPLYVPANNGDITFMSSSAGAWNIHDFKVPRQLDIAGKNFSHTLTERELYYFPIEEIVDNHPDDLTPEGLFNFTSRFDQAQLFTKFSVDKALEIGIVKETTYEQVYKDSPDFLRQISAYSATDYSVLQVTPKGNTLIIPTGKGGKKTPPLEEGKKSFELLPGVS